MRYRLLVLFVFITISCSSKVDIEKIINNPREYVGKEVSVKGNVVDVFSMIVIKYFVVEDSTGQISVITDKPLPLKGQRVKITGTVGYFSLGTKHMVVLNEVSDN